MLGDTEIAPQNLINVPTEPDYLHRVADKRIIYPKATEASQALGGAAKMGGDYSWEEPGFPPGAQERIQNDIVRGDQPVVHTP